MTSHDTLDLSALEAAAAKVGLAGLRARVVPRDPRRGSWFHWEGATLDVSEAVVDRCPPDDASALLVMTVLERRRLRALRARVVGAVVGALVIGALLAEFVGSGAGLGVGALALVVVGVYAVYRRAEIWRQADDEAVVLLGDAQSLVRGLNRMNQEELVIGSVRTPARPDLHGRAERLIRIHRLLCEPPAEIDASP